MKTQFSDERKNRAKLIRLLRTIEELETAIARAEAQRGLKCENH